jgi:hypothetical protein
MGAEKIEVSDADRIAFIAHAEEIAWEWSEQRGAV